ncbi:MAG: ASCH domain-containing protein [Bacillaceae bacterium]|nr:ASCH domain-containing protein [Bacillaceae bacterium]
MTRALIIREPWANKILCHEKTVEIRGSRTNVRGTIGIISGGTGTISGIVDLIDVSGPLTLEAYNNLAKERGGAIKEALPYKKTYAWRLANPKKFLMPVPYKHPNGAVIWVRLQEETIQEVEYRIKNQEFYA